MSNPHLPEPSHKIIVIDRQPYWRDFFRQTLDAARFAVTTFGSYGQLCSYDKSPNHRRELVVLGCANIGPAERHLIDEILARKHPLVILCATSLPREVAHSFFQQKGVADVTEKTTDQARLIELVQTALGHQVPRNSYEAVEQDGGL